MTLVVNYALKALERIAPLRLAEKWDNVGRSVSSIQSQALTPSATGRTLARYSARPIGFFVVFLMDSESPVLRPHANRILLTIE